MSVYIQLWRGSNCVQITDLTNAGIPGKRCDVLTVRGAGVESGPYREGIESILGGKPDHFSERDIQEFVGTSSDCIQFDMGDCRGIDAPRLRLVAGVDGNWSGESTSMGIALRDYTDRNNLPAMITTRQTPAQAHKLAAKVWDRVRVATSFRIASDILTEAGCKLHYYCRID